MIEVQNLVKYYGHRQVLHGLSFSVCTGRVCGFLGPNGSGKSTTMDILSGLLGPSSGIARVCGFDVVTHTRDVKAHVGYLPDNPPLYKEMLVQDFLYFVAELRGIQKSARIKIVKEVMEECDVANVAKRLIGNLSKGYRQRVALCAALVHKPNVLILDEPTEGLDPNQILHIRNLIKKLANERTVILSSHILSEVQATCDDVIIINNGHIATTMALDKAEAQHSSYLYTFASRTNEALNWFQNLPFVSSAQLAQQKEQAILVRFAEEFWESKTDIKEDLAKITARIVQESLPLIGLEECKEGLDKIFFDVVRSQQ